MNLINGIYGKKYAHLRTKKFEKGFGEGLGLEEVGLNPETVSWLDKAIDAYWHDRIYKILDKVGTGIADEEIFHLWKNVLDDMYGEDNPRKKEIFDVALAGAIVGITTFFIENIETIGKVVAAIFILNTAFKFMAVLSGLVSTAVALQTWLTAQLATGMTIASVAAGILNVAMRLIPFVAVAGAIALVVNGIIVMGDQAERTGGNVRVLNGEIVAGGDAAAASTNKYEKVAGGFKLIEIGADNAADAVDNLTNVLSPNQGANRQRRNELRDANRRARAFRSALTLPDFSSLLSGGGGGGSSQAADISDSLNQLMASQQQAANQEQGILDKRLSAFQAFNNAVKGLFGQIKDSILSSFTLPTLGNSVNSITRNIAKLLERTRGFASSISQLSGLGLNSSLLQQVIQSGPIAGSKLASAIVGVGSAFISQLNSSYGEFGSLASGIAGTGTTSAFGTQQTVNNYSIEVTGGLATGSDVGRAVVNAIRDYERQSGAAWRA